MTIATAIVNYGVINTAVAMVVISIGKPIFPVMTGSGQRGIERRMSPASCIVCGTPEDLQPFEYEDEIDGMTIIKQAYYCLGHLQEVPFQARPVRP